MPAGTYDVHFSEAVVNAIGETAATSCMKNVFKDPVKHCREVQTPRGAALYCQCRGSKGTTVGVLIHLNPTSDGENIDVDIGLAWEFGQGN